MASTEEEEEDVVSVSVVTEAVLLQATRARVAAKAEICDKRIRKMGKN